MENINISILKEVPNLTESMKLKIEPLAPLSMVNDLPGSFYKSLTHPTKKMLCGLFENLLGWHIDIADRIEIHKDLKKIRKNQKLDYIKIQEGSTYIPLLWEYFEIESVDLPDSFSYNDLWKKAYRRADEHVHPKGTPNLDYSLVPKTIGLSDKELKTIFRANLSKFPRYYTSPTNREFVVLSDVILIDVLCDAIFSSSLKQMVSDNNIGYLGTSEGWIHLEVNDE